MNSRVAVLAVSQYLLKMSRVGAKYTWSISLVHCTLYYLSCIHGGKMVYAEFIPAKTALVAILCTRSQLHGDWTGLERNG